METKDYSGIIHNSPLPDPRDVVAPEDALDLLDDYIDSTESQLEELERATLQYEAGIARTENEANIRRILHKLKGEAGIVGIDDISELCHQAETAFDELADNRRPDMLFRFKDWVYSAIRYLGR